MPAALDRRSTARACGNPTSLAFGARPMNPIGVVEMRYPWPKLALLLLLTIDVVIFARVGEPGSGIDAFAWLLLLMLVEAEAEFSEQLRARGASLVVQGLRAAAIVAILAAASVFFREKDWVDASNSLLWIAVAAMLEIEVRYPRTVARFRRAFRIAAGVLYGGLALLVIVWLARGEWIDAYDAALWLAAFVVIERDVMRFSDRAAAASGH